MNHDPMTQHLQRLIECKIENLQQIASPNNLFLFWQLKGDGRDGYDQLMVGRRGAAPTPDENEAIKRSLREVAAKEGIDLVGLSMNPDNQTADGWICTLFQWRTAVQIPLPMLLPQGQGH